MRNSWYQRVAEDARLAQWCHVKLESFALNESVEKPAEQIAEWLYQQYLIPCVAITPCRIAVEPPYRHTNYQLLKPGVASDSKTINPHSFSVWEHPERRPFIAFVTSEERKKINLWQFEEESFARAFPVVVPFDKVSSPLEHRLHEFRTTVEKRADLKIVLHELTPWAVGHFANFMQQTSVDWYIRYDKNPPIPPDYKIGNEWHYHLYVAQSDLIYVGTEGYERWWGAFIHNTGDEEILYIAARRRSRPHESSPIAGIWRYESLPIEERLAIAPILIQSFDH